MKKVLVVAAHPDDEVLGCGASIARMVEQGAQARIIVCGEGLTSRPGADRAALEQLDADLHSAAMKLGVNDVLHLDWPDNRFDSLDLLELVQVLEEHALPFTPDIVFTHHRGDLNIDHRYVHEAVMTCFRPLPGRSHPMLLAMEVASSTMWSAPDPGQWFTPSVFVDVTTTLEKKVAAMEYYRSEKGAWPHPRSAEALRAAARYWGSRVGVEAAEPFVLLRYCF